MWETTHTRDAEEELKTYINDSTLEKLKANSKKDFFFKKKEEEACISNKHNAAIITR